MCHTKIVNRAYTLNSRLDFYLLLEHFTTFTYKALVTNTLTNAANAVRTILDHFVRSS